MAGRARLLRQGRARGDEEGGRVLQGLERGGRLWQVVGRPGGFFRGDDLSLEP